MVWWGVEGFAGVAGCGGIWWCGGVWRDLVVWWDDCQFDESVVNNDEGHHQFL